MSGVHFHPAKFISQLPSILISRLSNPGDLVVDPYCGSGTTLMEAQRLGRRCFGSDINPVSVLISSAKTLPMTAADARQVLDVSIRAATHAEPSDRLAIPSTVQAAKWYSPSVAMSLAAIHADIEATSNADARVLKTFCFSSVLLKVCRETRHYGYVCDNTAPKDDPERRVVDILARAANEIVEAFAERSSPKASATILECPASEITEHLDDQSVDLVVTSPPYEGVVDYIKTQRLTLEWLGIDLEQLRKRETGARSKRHRIKAAADFASELKQSFSAIHRVLKPGAPCAVVFGVSPHRTFTFDNLLDVLRQAGFELRSDHLRDVPVQRRMMPSVLNERLFVLTKPLGD